MNNVSTLLWLYSDSEDVIYQLDQYHDKFLITKETNLIGNETFYPYNYYLNQGYLTIALTIKLIPQVNLI